MGPPIDFGGHPLGKTKETAEAEARVEKGLKEKVD
jgi:hypothetical protein